MMIGMQAVLTIAQWLVRITGVLQLIMGLLIWFENQFGLIQSHMLIGLVLVIALIVLAAVAARAGVPTGMAVSVAILAVIVLVFGMTQASILPGSLHWIVQILHLLLGMAAVGMGEAIGGRLRRSRVSSA
jgi:hypothetical protein